MGTYKPKDSGWIRDRFDQTRSKYGDALAHMADIESVWKGETRPLAALENDEIEAPKPSQPNSLMKKMAEMVAVRPTRHIACIGRGDGEAEARKVDFMENFQQGYWRQHRKVTKKDVWFKAAWLALLRGRSAMYTCYRAGDDKLPVRVFAWDAAHYFSEYSENGLDYVVRERFAPRYQLYDYFRQLDEGSLSRQFTNVPDLMAKGKNGKAPDLFDELRVLEYYDDKYCAWTIEDTNVLSLYEHPAEQLTIHELHFNQTGLDDPRWADDSFLGPVEDDLKAIAILQSKLATAVTAWFFPKIVYQNGSGIPVEWDPEAAPNEIQEAAPDSKFEVVRADPNEALVQHLAGMFQENVSKNALPDLVFFKDMPNASGFQTAQVLNTIKDSIAHFVEQIEEAFGLVCGDVAMLHELYAKDEGWTYPMPITGSRRKLIRRVKAEDIDEHYDYDVSLKIMLPQDRQAVVQMRNMLLNRDQATGARMSDLQTANEISGYNDIVEDASAAQERLEFETLLEQDPAAKQIHQRYLMALAEPKLNEMERFAKRAEARKKKKVERQTEKDIAEGMSQDIVLPSEVLMDPVKLDAFYNLVKQGQLPEVALQMAEQGLPMGVPGAMPPPPTAGSERSARLAAMLGGASAEPMSAQGAAALPDQAGQPPMPQAPTASPVPSEMPGGQATPTAFTGYEGLSPEVMPAAMQGAQPRTALDQANLQMEQFKTRSQRVGRGPRS